MRLIAEIERIQKGENKKEPEKETYLDLFNTKNPKLKERVLIPTKMYPRVRAAAPRCSKDQGWIWQDVDLE